MLETRPSMIQINGSQPSAAVDQAGQGQPRRVLTATAWWTATSLAAASAAIAFTTLPAFAAQPAASQPKTAQASSTLATLTIKAGSGAAAGAFEGQVEAVRQSVIASQVSGAIVALPVKAGDRVRKGQVLARLDARAAEQSAAASAAQVQAVRARLEVARRDYERQQQLAAQSFISVGALERAQAEFRATQAEAQAQLAQADAARTQSGLGVLYAPYDGVVADVQVTMGDMAMPGRALMTVYDPAALRITAAVPQSVAARLPQGLLPQVEIATGATPAVQRMQVLPAVDPATHTVQVRVDLQPAKGEAALLPGTLARLLLPVPAAAQGGAAPATSANVLVPRTALVRRGELWAVYVVDAKGQPALRQVRTGRSQGDQVEILSGLDAGERVAQDPQAAARMTAVRP